MDLKKIDLIEAELKKAFEAINKKHNVSLKTGNITYSDTNFTTKITCSDVTDGVVQTKEMTEFIERAKFGLLNGLSLKDLEKTFSIPGTRGTFKIIGYNSRARKYPIHTQNIENGKVICIPLRDAAKFCK